MKKQLLLLATAFLAITGLAGLSSLSSGSLPAIAQEGGPELAVYNQGIALVKDTRTLSLEQGVQQVTITDVAQLLDPTSVLFRSLTDPEGTTVLEQNYEYDLVGPEKLLAKYVDERIQIITSDGTIYEGTLLSGSGDIILRDDEGRIIIVRRDQVRDFTFPALPEGLITRPSLVWLVDAEQAGEQQVELTYITNGISWNADYVLLLSQDNKSIDLDGWVTLENHSGATYNGAKLKLIAGDINRVSKAEDMVLYRGVAEAAAPAPAVEERSFFEYHLYEVQRPVTIKDNQTKQIEFVTAAGAPVEKFFVYDGAPNYYFWGYLQTEPSYGADTGVRQVRTMLSFSTDEDGVNTQLPQGTVRVYQEDVDGSALLLGEDSIEHTPKGEEVRLYIGDAFDIVGERIQTNFQKISRNVVEETFEITLRNHKEEAVQVRVTEHLFRWSNWEIISETAEHSKLDAQNVEWRLDVPADGETTLTYTVRYSW